MHLVKGAGPEAVADRFIGVFDKTLVKEERPGVAAMNNGGLSAAFKSQTIETNSSRSLESSARSAHLE